MTITRFHHIAYRCRDTQETVDFYTGILGLKYAAAHMLISRHDDGGVAFHSFFQLPDGSHIAFFELPEEAPQGEDPNTPSWVQHIAFEVDSVETLRAERARLEQAGVKCEQQGVKVGKIITSIYFRDPSGHRLEMCVPLGRDADELARSARDALDAWNADKSVAARRRAVQLHNESSGARA
ncbi:MAG: VOC family protein [Burkholderiaceae bacterium]